MTTPRKFLIEGIDGLGKDRLIMGIQDRLGYHAVVHCSKPFKTEYYAKQSPDDVLRGFQMDTFATMFSMLRSASLQRIIYNRAHLGECVYAPIYRRYSGDYVFDLENEAGAAQLSDVRLVLLTEHFESSRHFRDDGQSLGPVENRRDEQERFLGAFNRSAFADKRAVCVTNTLTGQFRPPDEIRDEVLA